MVSPRMRGRGDKNAMSSAAKIWNGDRHSTFASRNHTDLFSAVILHVTPDKYAESITNSNAGKHLHRNENKRRVSKHQKSKEGRKVQ